MRAQAAAPRRPNVLVILADDLGFSDARCCGGEIDTPNLDRMAYGGLRFTQGYTTARCGPSRSCILTGLYAQQTASDVMTPGRILGVSPDLIEAHLNGEDLIRSLEKWVSFVIVPILLVF